MAFKVANIIASFNSKSGGPPRTVSLIAAAGAGHWNSELFTTNYRESADDPLLFDLFPGHVKVLPASCRSTWRGLLILSGMDSACSAQLQSSVAPDLLHIHGLWTPYLAAFADEAFRRGIPYVLAPHGMLERWSLSVKSVRKRVALQSYQRRVIERAAVVHATSDEEANNVRRIGSASTVVFTIPNIVELPPTGLAEKAETPQRRRVLLFLSRLHEKKGLDLLLQAWHEIAPHDWELKIAGSGDASYIERLQTFCKANSLRNVDFVGHRDGEDREALFRRASAFVLPSYSENFGNVVGEALIRGLPVITTTGTPWSGIVAHRCGWYIPPTLAALKRAIRETMSTDPQTLEDMGQRGREFVMRHFSMSAVRGSLLAMYQYALQSRDSVTELRCTAPP